MSDELFPDEALAFLQKARFDEHATRGFELMSLSFWWSDEKLREVGRICRSNESHAHRAVMEFRSSLILGRPIEVYRPAWDQLLAACPNWPGFRPERLSPDLLSEWTREKRRACVAFEREVRSMPTADLS